MSFNFSRTEHFITKSFHDAGDTALLMVDYINALGFAVFCERGSLSLKATLHDKTYSFSGDEATPELREVLKQISIFCNTYPLNMEPMFFEVELDYHLCSDIDKRFDLISHLDNLIKTDKESLKNFFFSGSECAVGYDWTTNLYAYGFWNGTIYEYDVPCYDNYEPSENDNWYCNMNPILFDPEKDLESIDLPKAKEACIKLATLASKEEQDTVTSYIDSFDSSPFFELLNPQLNSKENITTYLDAVATLVAATGYQVYVLEEYVDISGKFPRKLFLELSESGIDKVKIQEIR